MKAMTGLSKIAKWARIRSNEKCFLTVTKIAIWPELVCSEGPACCDR